MPTLKVSMPPLHPRQAEVKNSAARFRVLAAGRRFGKTRLGSALCIEVATSGRRAWWIAPTYKMAAVGWRGIKQLALQFPGVQVREVEHGITLPGGGTVHVRSADEPNSLRGEGLDFAVMDECAFMKEEAWTEAIRPALSDRLGRAMFISTPKGMNWFWRLWTRGQDGGEWQSWQLPTSDNPYIAPSEIEAARESLPERVFQQEYMAVFLDDAGGVFRRVMDAATAEAQAGALAGHDYVFGVDWAKQNDFTVITVLDTELNAVVALDRFNQVDYTVQTNRLKALAERFKPRLIIAERNSIGEPLIEHLQRDGLPVQAFQTTQASKQVAIDALALAFERGALRIPRDPVLIAELQAYEAERLPSGMLRYNAPEGMHDDCVMSLALAWQGIGAGVTAVPDPFAGW